MALWFRVTFAIWLVLISALSLSVFLNHAKFDSTYAELSRSRFQVLAQDVRGAVESGLELGLGLGELRSPQQMVERTKADAAEIRSVVVADSRGVVLFDSDGIKDDKTLPAEQVAAIVALGNSEHVWSMTVGGEVLLGLPILNPFQVPVGVIALRYDASRLVAVKDKALGDMLEAMLIIVAVLTVATAPLVMWTFAGVRRTFLTMLQAAAAALPAEALAEPSAQAVSELADDDGAAPPPTSDMRDGQIPNVGVDVADDTLEAEFSAFARSAAGALERLHAAQSR